MQSINFCCEEMQLAKIVEFGFWDLWSREAEMRIWDMLLSGDVDCWLLCLIVWLVVRMSGVSLQCCKGMYDSIFGRRKVKLRFFEFALIALFVLLIPFVSMLVLRHRCLVRCLRSTITRLILFHSAIES